MKQSIFKMFIIKYYTTNFFINYDCLNLDSNFMIYMIGNCILITNFTGFFNLQPLQMYCICIEKFTHLLTVRMQSVL